MSRRTVAFVLGFVGIAAPQVSNQPPHGWVGWVLLVVGSMAGGLLATELLSAVLGPLPLPNPDGLWRKAVVIWNRLRGLLLPVAVLGVTIIVGMAAARGVGELRQRLRGCTAPVEVPVVASPETLATANFLARTFESATSDRDCPRASLSVYPGDSTQVQHALFERWNESDNSYVADYLHDLGPRPQLWMPDSTVDVDRLTARILAAAGSSPLGLSTVYGWSPLVLATRKDAAPGTASGDWASLLRTADDAGFNVVRPESSASISGELLLEAAYPSRNHFTPADIGSAKAVEKILDDGRQGAEYPVGDAAALLRKYQSSRCGTTRPVALILPEQFVRRPEFAGPQVHSLPNCANDSTGSALAAHQPQSTPVLNHPVVALSWPGAEADPATQIAAEFIHWLGTDAGGQQVESTGLNRGGYGLTHLSNPAPPATELDKTLLDAVNQALANRANVTGLVELMLAVDTSGSMSSRLDLGAAVLDGLAERLNDRDHLGLLTFGGSPARVRSLVSLARASGPVNGAASLPTRDAVRAALLEVHPAGGTPLLKAIEQGIATLAHPVADGSSTSATARRVLVVLTDGKDTAGGHDATFLANQAQLGRVQIFAVAAGAADCKAPVLLTITQRSHGSCVPAQGGPEAAADALTAAIWG